MNPWLERREESGIGSKTSDANLAFQCRIDRSRITNSAAFRRLQGKTQVMGVGEHDFFRTRLTHSLEVAQIGAAINSRMQWLADNVEKWSVLQAIIPPDALIETACLAHDIGHPAFGHNGESILNYFMVEHGGFEGNGQTLRILARLGEYSETAGYNLMRRTLLAVLKYPATASQVAKAYPEKPESIPRNIEPWYPPKSIHDDDKEILDWILSPLSESDRIHFTSLNEKQKTQYKSFDCSIMELADDIGYGVHDLEDALAMGLLTPEKVARDLKEELELLASWKKHNQDSHYYLDKILGGERRLLKQAITNIVFTLVNQTEPAINDRFEEPLLKHQVVMREEAHEVLKRLKQYVFTEVIAQPRLRTIEYKGKRIIAELFEAFVNNWLQLLPIESSQIILQAENNEQVKHRVVCDYIASMSDSEASSMYQRLYLPGNGSVFEPI